MINQLLLDFDWSSSLVNMILLRRLARCPFLSSLFASTQLQVLFNSSGLVVPYSSISLEIFSHRISKLSPGIQTNILTQHIQMLLERGEDTAILLFDSEALCSCCGYCAIDLLYARCYIGHVVDWANSQYRTTNLGPVVG